jgi:O-antigen ligase
VLGVTAGVSPRTAIELCVGILAFLLMVRSLLAGLVLFTVATFPNNLPHGLGAGSTLAKPLGLVLVLSWLLALLQDRDRPFLLRDAPGVAWTAIALIGWAALSLAWAPAPGTAASAVFRLLQVVVLLFIAYSAIRSGRDLAIAAGGFVLAASATSAYALASGDLVAGRLSGGIQNPNFLAANIVPALAISGFMLAARVPRVVQVALVGTAVLNVVALVATGSRGALIALSATLVAAVAFAGRYRPKALATVLVVASFGLVYLAASAGSGTGGRLTDISVQASNGRAALWRIATEMGRDHPLGGVGLANFPLVEPQYFQTATVLLDPTNVVGRKGDLVVHNTYLELLAELGIVGVGLFVVLLAAPLVAALRRVALVDRARAEGSAVARGVIVGSVGLFANYIFDSGEYQKQLWLLLGLLAAVGWGRFDASRAAD